MLPVTICADRRVPASGGDGLAVDAFLVDLHDFNVTFSQFTEDAGSPARLTSWVPWQLAQEGAFFPPSVNALKWTLFLYASTGALIVKVCRLATFGSAWHTAQVSIWFLG
jgi:hypothetical protein